MLTNVKNIFKVADLRNKVLFTFAMIGIYRIGAQIRVPGVDANAINDLREGAQTGALGLFNLFSGGAFESFSIFALGIMPYITASIIMQVLGVVIPKLEELQQEGAVGQRKITQYTRYVTVALALMQATVLVFLFGNGGNGAFFSAVQAPPVQLLPGGIWPRGYLIIPTMVAGTAVLMWMGELISQRGVGNGMSMIIFASVLSGLPGGFYSILQVNKVFWFVVMIVVTVGIIAAVVFVELGQRRIPVQFAKRVVGRRMMGGQNTYIPLKVNQSGVIPIIFASSILLLPAILSSFIGNPSTADDAGWWDQLRAAMQDFVNNYILNSQNIVYVSIFALMIVAFAYFYNSIAFDPVRQADQIRRQGGFIPGVRPGPRTEAYLAKAVNRITLPGAVFIAFIAILPYIILWAAGVNSFQFAGTSILIAVGVALELMRQIDSQLMLRNYEGFLK
ncbi:MAG: preprotein translocase subunit SecY [Ilumatobacter coccineus]|uniref:Protein translocase subunit SecY n=1 Tax=Ilumatobacter coccineus TaxID=467094 RepID=A0A2G6KGB7_9ACTN|nr:MAG: preprotein translocase subunit SecY [Ilumatobacter coccineus]